MEQHNYLYLNVHYQEASIVDILVCHHVLLLSYKESVKNLFHLCSKCKITVIWYIFILYQSTVPIAVCFMSCIDSIQTWNPYFQRWRQWEFFKPSHFWQYTIVRNRGSPDPLNSVPAETLVDLTWSLDNNTLYWASLCCWKSEQSF